LPITNVCLFLVVFYAGSAVAIEQIFSGSRDTISLRRANLKPETIRTLMLVKQQLRLARTAVHDILGAYHFLIIDSCLVHIVDKLVAEFIYLFVILTVQLSRPVYGCSNYCTVPAKGLKLVDTAKIWYGQWPYTQCLEYGRSHIWYS